MLLGGCRVQEGRPDFIWRVYRPDELLEASVGVYKAALVAASCMCVSLLVHVRVRISVYSWCGSEGRGKLWERLA